MIMKKVLAVLVAAVMTIGLSACGKGNEAGSTQDADGSAGGNSDTLSVMIWDTFQEPGIQTLLDEFTQETGIKAEVTVVMWDEYWTLLEAGAQGDTLPDVFWMHSNEAERYMSNGMLLDITDKMSDSSQVDTSKFPDDIVELYTYDGKNYAMPKDIDTIALWYNKSMFDEAGISYPDDSWTWDDFREAAKQLTKDDGSQFGYALRPTNDQDSYYNIIYSYGGYVISEDKTVSGMDDAKTIEAMEVIEGMLQDGSIPSLETLSENGADVLFTSGKVAMVTQGSWMLPSFGENEYTKENADIAVLPKGPEGRVSIYNGLGWAASADGKNSENAWKLLEFFGSEKGQLRQAELGITMSAYEGTSDAWVNSTDLFNLEAYFDMMDNMVIRPYSKNTLSWNNMFHEKFKAAWTMDQPMKEVCEDVASQMNDVLAAE